VTRLGAGQFGVRIRAGSRHFLLSMLSRPTPGRTQPPYSVWIGVFLLPGAKLPCCVAAHFYLVPRPRMSGSLPLLPLCLHSVHRDNIYCSQNPLYQTVLESGLSCKVFFILGRNFGLHSVLNIRACTPSGRFVWLCVRTAARYAAKTLRNDASGVSSFACISDLTCTSTDKNRGS
jgi:hypothetical protein